MNNNIGGSILGYKYVRRQKGKVFAGALAAVLIVGGFLLSQSATTHATANTVLVGGGDITNESGTSSIVTDLRVTSDDTNPSVAVKLFVSHGTISMTTVTGLTFYNADGTVRGAGQPSNSSDLQFGGAMNDVNAALATLHYMRTSGTGTDTLSASLVQPGEVFFSDNNHLYEYFPGPVTWSQAKTNAEGLSKYGAQGYLATITSQAENDFIKDRLKSDSWIGASDSAVEGAWKWVTGPESGQQFWQGTGSGSIVGGLYVHWNNPTTGGSGAEPNQSGDEDCAEFYYSNNGLWNDLSCVSTLGYIVEYGGLSGINPTVSSQDVGITTVTDATPPTTPGTPTAASLTTDTTPTVSWTTSSDSGTGLKNPAYTLEWSTSATFASVSGSTTTNSTSVSPPALSDGTWYFRVKATDNANNTATSGISSAVVIDTTSPTTPGMPSIGTAWTNDNTPTWNWTASTDGGSGLAYIAYGVQWSQDTGFFGLGGQAGATENSYTIPDGLNMTNSTWYFRVRGIDAAGNESAWSDYGTIHIDTVAPIISGVAATDGVSAGQEVITWASDKNTSSKVSYGPTSSLGATTAETDTSPRVQNHSVTLDNLVACSIYHFTVTSKDIAGNVVTSDDRSFITKGCAGSADVVSYTDAPITTAAGGSVSLDTISIEVPSGFAGSNADFQIKRIDNDPALGAIGKPAGMLLAGTKVYDIKALSNGTTAITSFVQPITITLHYTSAEIAALSESSLAIYRWDVGTGWTKLDGCTVNAAANTVTCTTTHFSTFALYGKAKPTSSGGSGSITNSDGSSSDETGAEDQVAISSSSATNTTSGDDSKTDSNTPEDNSTANETNGGTDQMSTTDGQNYDTAHGFNWWLLVLGLGIIGLFWWLLAWRRRRKKQADAR